MPTELLPAINASSGLFNLQDPTKMNINVLHHNVIPVKTGESGFSLMQRPTFGTHVDDSVSGGYGRAIMERNGKNLRLDQQFYHYGAAGDGSSADIRGVKGVHDGGDGAAVFSDSGEAFPTDGLGFDGMIIKNETDGSQSTVTANTGTTITGVLAGGTDNDWDDGDVMSLQDTDFDYSSMGTLTLFNQSGVDRIIIQNPGTNTTDVENGNCWYAIDENTAPVIITDPDMPGNDLAGGPMVRGAVSLNGYLFLGTVKGAIRNCNLDNVTLWTSGDEIVAERDASPGVYIGKQKDHVVFFSAEGIEFFYDNNNATDSPLTRREDLYYTIGCFHANSIVDTGDAIYFVGVNDNGTAGVYQLKGFVLEKISGELMDTICSRMTYTNPTFASCDVGDSCCAALVQIPDSGLFYVLTIDDATESMQGTFAMHLETGLVSKWYTGSNPTNQGTDAAWHTSFLLPISGSVNLPGDEPTSPNIYMFYNGTTAYLHTFDGSTQNNLSDLGLTAPFCGYYTPPIDINTNMRKRVQCVRILHHPSVDDSIDPSNITIAWKNFDTLEAGGFDRDSFPTGVTIDLSKQVARLYRGGIFRQRMYEVELTPNKRQIIKGLQLEYDLLRG